MEEPKRTFTPNPDDPSEAAQSARFLQPRQIAMIEEALASLGAFGEVRLVVENGRLRFVVTCQKLRRPALLPGPDPEFGIRSNGTSGWGD